MCLGIGYCRAPEGEKVCKGFQPAWWVGSLIVSTSHQLDVTITTYDHVKVTVSHD